MIFKILVLFDNTLTADDQYSLLNRENLTQLIQIHLFKNQKLFPNFVLHFLPRLTFEHCEKNDDNPHSSCISEITDCESRG